jgi:hypothetical protein
MSAHAELDQLRQHAAGERAKQRDLEVELEAARAEVDQAGVEISEAYAEEHERAVIAARGKEQAAVAKVHELQHRLDGAAIRVDRAQRQLDTFQRDRARDLLSERTTEAGEIADQLTHAVGEAVRLHRSYLAVRSDINTLVALIPGAVPRHDGPPSSHAWERQLQDLDRSVRDTPELPAPLPRWHGREDRQRDNKVASLMRTRRRRSQTTVELAERELRGDTA